MPQTSSHPWTPTRTLLRRILWYRERLKRAGGFTANEATEALEAHVRTVYRDVRYLETLGWDLEYSRRREQWVLASGEPALPLATLREGEVVALLVAEEAVRAYAGTPYAESLRSAFEKLSALLDQPVTLDLREPPLAFGGPPVRPVDARQFEQFLRACRERRRLQIEYRTLESGEVKTRRVDPYHLESYAGDRYVVAFDHLRGELRTFALGERVLAVRDTGERFERDPGFDPDAYRAAGFGLFRGGPVEEVVLRFGPRIAPYLREKVWDESELKEELTDGRLLLRMQAPVNVGLLRFVLQYGSECEVLAPEGLREQVGEELLKAAGLYGLVTRAMCW